MLFFSARSSAQPGAAIPQLVGPHTVSDSLNDYNPSLTMDGGLLYFARSSKGFKNAHIMVSEWKSGTWQMPSVISFTDTNYRDSDPCILPDGKTIYFVSDRPLHAGDRAPEKDLNIWYSVQKNQVWQLPVCVTELNSPADEYGPEWNPEGYLLFNSTREGGYGKSDIYLAKKMKGAWMQPENLGAAINSSEFEGDPVMSPDGKFLVFSSWKKEGSEGMGDLWISELSKGHFTDAKPLHKTINSAGWEFTPFFSANGKTLYYSSNSKTIANTDASVFNGKFNIFQIPFSRELWK